MLPPERFTIRVYGLLITKEGQILLSNERIGDFAFTKFPGGGMEFGEGALECLKREFFEETGISIEIIKHVYTCNFFVQGRLNPEEQVIGIYYLVKSKNNNEIILPDKVEQDFMGASNFIRFSLKPISDKIEDMLTFEMDKRAWREARITLL